MLLAFSPSSASDEASRVSIRSVPAPVGHWTLDEGSGTTVADISGNGNDGTIMDNPDLPDPSDQESWAGDLQAEVGLEALQLAAQRSFLLCGLALQLLA